MRAGIYRIRNITNGKSYVGSAVYFVSRWGKHRFDLRNGIHHSRHLQNAWNRYGEEAFVFEKLLVCSEDDCILYEQRAIDTLKPEYNMSPTAGSTRGVPVSEEHKAAIGRRMKERIAANPAAHYAITRKAHAQLRELYKDPYYRERRRQDQEQVVARHAEKIEFAGQTKTRKEWALALGIAPAALSDRILRWGVEKALSAPAVERHSREAHLLRITVSGRGRLYLYKGQELTLVELAGALGTRTSCITDYLKKHSYEEMLAFYEAGGRKRALFAVEYQGETMSVSELARRTGEPFQRLWRRITKQGMTAEQAVATRMEDVYRNRVIKGHRNKKCRS